MLKLLYTFTSQFHQSNLDWQSSDNSPIASLSLKSKHSPTYSSNSILSPGRRPIISSIFLPYFSLPPTLDAQIPVNHFQMKFLKWPYDCFRFYPATDKLCSLATIACWGILGLAVTRLEELLLQNEQVYIIINLFLKNICRSLVPNSSWKWEADKCFLIYGAFLTVLCNAYFVRESSKAKMTDMVRAIQWSANISYRLQDPPPPVTRQIDSKTAWTIAAIAAISSVKVSTFFCFFCFTCKQMVCRSFVYFSLLSQFIQISSACYIYFSTSPAVPSPCTLMLIEALFVLLTELLDNIRVFVSFSQSAR